MGDKRQVNIDGSGWVQAEHEKLRVYARAVDVAAALEVFANSLPERRADLRDQLWRASSSIPFNIAEGASEFSPREKARFYRMARRSSAECMAILDLVARSRKDAAIVPMTNELREIGAILTTMVQRTSERAR